ncbi:AAA family ATPase [Haemophilus influenzae]|uniref:AAA family ATPase n=1 Tax=Haemophilus influenzae TaxID=727 RepID=UPI00069392CD|nr:AAA family ATPase [Haemophilus influenzae]
MKLIELKVTKLFGILDYHIKFDSSEILIITGPNGYGKTVLLNIINSVLTNNLSYFYDLNFYSIELKFSDFDINIDKFNRSFVVKINDIQEPLNYSSDLLNKYIEPTQSSRLSYYKNMSCIFIKDQRISEGKDLIRECALELCGFMNSAQANYAKVAFELDSDFLLRFSNSISEGASTSIDNLKQRLIGVQSRLLKYSNYNLVPVETIVHNSFDEGIIKNEDLVLLKLYIDDMLLKLDPIENLYTKIKIFEDVINESVLSFKKISFNRHDGFYFISSNGDTIDYRLLSSGEKNQIVILFNLIFKSKGNDVVLIDEPEISLHVAWQKRFIDTILKINKINLFENIIISTHSPTIIGSHWDWTYDLLDQACVLGENSGDIK